MREQTTQTAVIYTRVSSARQAADGLSLEAQERVLTARAEQDGYRVQVARDAGRSGKSMKSRTGLLTALEDLNSGKAQALYVARLDRLARSVRDLLAVADMADRHGWRLVLLDLGVDTATPHGRLVLSMLGSVAEFERGLIRERQRDVHAERRARGLVWGVDAGNLPETPAQVRRMVADLRADGLTLQAIADRLNAEQVPTTRGGARWYPSTVRHLLNAPSLESVAA